MKTSETLRDKLIERILTILRPQLDGQEVVGADQHRKMQAAIQRFEADVRSKTIANS